jgi:hypothetical protein
MNDKFITFLSLFYTFVSWATFQSDCDCLIIHQSVVDDVEGEILMKKNGILGLIEASNGLGCDD